MHRQRVAFVLDPGTGRSPGGGEHGGSWSRAIARPGGGGGLVSSPPCQRWRPYWPSTMMPGIWSNPPYSTAAAAGRPVMIAIVPVSGASARGLRWPAAAAWTGSGPRRSAQACRRSPARSAPGRVGEQRGQPDAAGLGNRPEPGQRVRSQRRTPVRLSCCVGKAAGSDGAGSYSVARNWPRAARRRRSLATSTGSNWAAVRGVDQFVEQLVVPGRRQVEYFEDLAFFGAVRSPQAPFKCQDAHFEIGQRGHCDFGLSPPASPPAEHGMPRGHLDHKRGEHVRSRVVTKPNCLTFLTDFGLEDGFVAACHGVAARIAPGVRVIDVTHLVPPGDVRRGAAVLAQVVPSMPPGRARSGR